MGELSAPAFDMMPDTTVSPMPEKISSPAPVAVLEEPAAEIQPEISGDFMPDTFPPEPSQAAPVPEHIPKPAKYASKPAEKKQKKKKASATDRKSADAFFLCPTRKFCTGAGERTLSDGIYEKAGRFSVLPESFA